MPRRSFDEIFKITAVKLVTEEGFSVKEVSLQLEARSNSVCIDEFKKLKNMDNVLFSVEEVMKSIRRNEITRLEKENKRLKEQVELLKITEVFLKEKALRQIVLAKTNLNKTQSDMRRVLCAAYFLDSKESIKS